MEKEDCNTEPSHRISLRMTRDQVCGMDVDPNDCARSSYDYEATRTIFAPRQCKQQVRSRSGELRVAQRIQRQLKP